jgi:tetratricopeptide (TPR) repeat protein
MLEPHTAALLVDYFETFLREQDIEAFHRSVSARYTEGTLTRLARSGGVQARRGAVLALGLVGSFAVNETVAKSLRDPDPSVRNLAQSALWAIWFRADTPENNAALQEVQDLIKRERYTEAQDLAARLIHRAPNFAEAYNQRAIALFSQEKYAESAADCRHAIERNPYHIGALAGLGQCYLQLDRRRDALATFRRALKVQPFSTNLRETVERLEAEGD